MADREVEDNQIPVRRWIRRYYIQSAVKFIVICRHCQSKVNYRFILYNLYHHLIEKHSEELTEEQKIDNKIHWIWDYFIPKTDREAICKLCKKIVKHPEKNHFNLSKHLQWHKDEYRIFNPNLDSNMDVTSNNRSTAKSRDITIKEAEHQKALSTSTASNFTDNTDQLGVSNESASSTLKSSDHVMDHPPHADNVEEHLSLPGQADIDQKVEENRIPVRRWIRRHYIEPTVKFKAICRYCQLKITYGHKLSHLYHHLIEKHSEKLTEEQKMDVKVHWTWDYFIPKTDREAICKLCKRIVKHSEKNLTHLRSHLRRCHKDEIFDPYSASNMDNTSSNASGDMTIKESEYHKASSTSTASNFTNNTNELGVSNESAPSSSKSSDHVVDHPPHADNVEEHLSLPGQADQEVEENRIPVRRWIRRHYIESTVKFKAICRYCQLKITYRNHNSYLYHHLIEEHSEKLTEEQKMDDKVHWTWDYFIPKTDRRAICKLCKRIVKRSEKELTHLSSHLRRCHKDEIFHPYSASNMDNTSSNASGGMTIKESEYQKALSTSTASNFTDNTNELGVSNESAPSTSKSSDHVVDHPPHADNVEEHLSLPGQADQEVEENRIPVRRWIRRHYIESTVEFKAICRYCQLKVTYVHRFSYLYQHLIGEHSEKLTEEQKMDDKVHWTWDYFILKTDREAICKLCKRILKHGKNHFSNLIRHLRLCHKDKIFDPYSASNMDDTSSNTSAAESRDMTMKEVERQKALSTSTASNFTDNTDELDSNE